MNKKNNICFLILIFILISCEGVTDTERVNITVSVNPEGAGNILTSGGNEIGNTAEFLAVENEGWNFAGWSGDINSLENPASIVLEDDIQITGNFSLFVNNYLFDLVISDASAKVNLIFGQKPGATDGFDSGIDAEAPPPPPESLHAWFQVNDLQLFDDFRNAFSSEIIWIFKVTNAVPGNVKLQWSSEIEEFSGSLTLSSIQSDVSINMLENNSFEFDSNQIDEFMITFSIQK